MRPHYYKRLFFISALITLGLFAVVITSGQGSQPFNVPNAQQKTFKMPDILSQNNITLPSAPQASTNSTVASTSDFVRVVDDVEILSMRVPKAWDDISWGHWERNNIHVGIYLVAAPDLGAYYDNTGPGVFYGVSDVLIDKIPVSNPALEVNPAVLRLLATEFVTHRGRCNNNSRYDFVSNYQVGKMDYYFNCDQQPITQLIVGTMPAHQQQIHLLRISLANSTDVLIAEEILNSYQVLIPSLDDPHHEDSPHNHSH